MRAAARTKIRAGVVLGVAALIAPATACTDDGSDANLCKNEVTDFYTAENLRAETDYLDSEIRDLVDDPQVKSNRWAECMTGMGWLCTSVEPIECSTESDGPVTSPFS
jgi:hypothetical protein